MDLDALYSALVGADKQARESAPYNNFKSVTDQIAPQMIIGSAQRDEKGNSRYSTAESILGPLIIGALGGLADRGNDSYVADRNAEASSLLTGILAGANPEKPRQMSPSIYSGLSQAGDFYKASRVVDQADEQRKANLASRPAIISAMAQANTPQQRQQILDLAKQTGIIEGDIALPTSAAPIVKPKVESLFPGESLNEKRAVLLQQQMDMGLPGGAAQKEVADQLAAYKAANSGSVDRVEAARKRAAMLKEIAGTAQAGMEGAGETGGAIGPIRNALSAIYALGNQEETDQRASQVLLDSVSPEIIKMSRSPGAVSDYESKLYLGAGPSSGKTPEMNQTLIAKMNNLADLENEYASFLEAYQAEKGTTMPTNGAPGAEVLWNQYKKANPIFVKGKGGALDINSTRKPWQQFFSTGAAPSGIGETGAVPPTTMTPAAQTKTVNGTTYQKVPGGWEPVK